MGIYDQAARYAAHADTEACVRRVQRGCGLDRAFSRWHPTRAVPKLSGGERDADRVAELEGDPALIVLEFQSTHDPGKLAVTLEEVGALRAREKRDGAEYLVLAALVYLVGRCPVTVLDMRTPEGFGTLHRPLIWDVEADDAGEELGKVARGEASWGMLFWVPLMGGADDEAVVTRWKEAVEAWVADRTMRSNLAGVSLVFAELAGRFRVWEAGLEGWGMTESQVVNRWVSQSVEKTQLAGARAFLIRLLRGRFPNDPIPPEVLRTIEEQPSLSMLEDWFQEAISVPSLAGFIAVLRR